MSLFFNADGKVHFCTYCSISLVTCGEAIGEAIDQVTLDVGSNAIKNDIELLYIDGSDHYSFSISDGTGA